MIDLINNSGINETKLPLLEELNQLVTIDQFYWGDPFSKGLVFGFVCKPASGYEDTLLSPSLHRSSEVTDLGWRNCISVTFRLKNNLDADKGIDLEDPFTIDPTISGTAFDNDLYETRGS